MMIATTTIKKVIPVLALLMQYGVLANGQQGKVSINIDLAKTYQRIDNFGASDAWACQFIGKWSGEKKEQIADFLFSNDTLADGSPRGIALSLWRFNIGAGSAAQAEKSGIKDEWRRAESFLNANGTYNWQSQAGQMWFLSAAKKRGVNQFMGFVNSPPVNFTLNGKAYAAGGKSNIAADKYEAFADYLSAVEKGIKKTTGISLDYISPVNEPQWDWSDAGQEGCPYTNAEIAGLTRAIDTSFNNNHIPSKIIVTEAGSLVYLLKDADKPGKGSQIDDFFKQGSVNYIGDLKHLKKTIIGHSYFTTSPDSTAKKLRRSLTEQLNKYEALSFWQSEYCILGDNAGEINGEKRDLGIDAALYLAKVIHTDLSIANASAWQWWTAVSPYDYKDGLIYVDKNKTDGNYYASKMLWAMGNYSRFVRPGAVRVDAQVNGGPLLQSPLLISAFKKGNQLTVVVVNNNTTNVPLNIVAGSAKISKIRVFTTSSSADLQAGTADNNMVAIQPRSVTTIIATIY
jgi:O-glycosyl hydrolase